MAFILALLPATGVNACESAFQSISAYKDQNTLGGGSWELESVGDLNADQVQDWVGILKAKDESLVYNQLFVLVSSRCGFVVGSVSKRLPLSGGNSWIEDLEIRKGSVFVRMNSKTASSAQSNRHQFKLQKGGWRLIGLTMTSLDLDSGGQSELDINLLTGDFIATRKSGDGKGRVKKGKKKNASYYLNTFSFSNEFADFFEDALGET